MKIKKKSITIYIMLLLIVVIVLIVFNKLYSSAQHGKALAKLTVIVTDEAGSVIPDADVSATFDVFTGWTESRSYTKRGKSNEYGEFSATYRTLDKVFVGARKQGYYYSNKQVKFKNTKGIKWQPWNPSVEVILRKKVNPIPLYAKKISNFKLIETNTCYKYDLFIGDWLKPYGKGESADLNISFNYEKKDRYNYIWKCIISTTTSDNGFKYITDLKTNSVFHFPYIAPENGFIITNLIYNIEHINGQSTPKSIEPFYDNLFFRIRTEKGKNGYITKCYYGKLTRLDCQFGSTICEGRLSFTYYFNPTANDRNLEFNVESNLFHNLDWEERVSKP